MAIIVLDPGHGGSAAVGGSSPNNAVGPTGLLEKSVTLDVAKRARARLQAAGHQVKMTRTTDVNLGLAARAAVAKSASSPVFVSIHLNGFNHAVQGTETLLDVDHTTASRSLAKAVHARVLVATGLANRGVKAQPLGVLKLSRHASSTACCLIELSFMDVRAEEARLKTDAYKDTLADALAKGVSDYLSEGETEALATYRAQGLFEDGFEALAAMERPVEGAKRNRTNRAGATKQTAAR